MRSCQIRQSSLYSYFLFLLFLSTKGGGGEVRIKNSPLFYSIFFCCMTSILICSLILRVGKKTKVDDWTTFEWAGKGWKEENMNKNKIKERWSGLTAIHLLATKKKKGEGETTRRKVFGWNSQPVVLSHKNCTKKWWRGSATQLPRVLPWFHLGVSCGPLTTPQKKKKKTLFPPRLFTHWLLDNLLSPKKKGFRVQ